MEFEYDPHKSTANKLKHGIDFEEAKSLWKDKRAFHARVTPGTEIRFLMVAKLKLKHWNVIFTNRGNFVRIISVRRSRKTEIELYDND